MKNKINTSIKIINILPTRYNIILKIKRQVFNWSQIPVVSDFPGDGGWKVVFFFLIVYFLIIALVGLDE